MALNHERLCDIFETNAFDVRRGMWFSTTDPNTSLDGSYIPSQNDGFFVNNGSGFVEIEGLGQMSASVGSSVAAADPYSTRLRPMTDMRFLLNKKKVVLVSLAFRCFDVRLSGGDQQDAATYTAIDNSLSTNTAFAASRFRRTVPVDWQPNWFRPEFWINNVNVLRDVTDSFYGTVVSGSMGQEQLVASNLGDKSIGLPCPIEFSDMYAVINEPLIELPKVYGQVVQYIDSGVLAKPYVRYPVMCYAEFVTTT